MFFRNLTQDLEIFYVGLPTKRFPDFKRITDKIINGLITEQAKSLPNTLFNNIPTNHMITRVNTDTRPEAINLLSPLKTRATLDSADAVLADEVSRSNVKTFVDAPSQEKLVDKNHETTLIEQVDAEPLSTIGQLRSYLCNRLNVHHLHLKYKQTLLDNDNNTLASYGWAPGEFRTITVHADDQPDIILYCINIRLQ